MRKDNRAAHASKPTTATGMWLTNDVDRLIEVYETVARDEEFWVKPEVYGRVID